MARLPKQYVRPWKQRRGTQLISRCARWLGPLAMRFRRVTGFGGHSVQPDRVEASGFRATGCLSTRFAIAMGSAWRHKRSLRPLNYKFCNVRASASRSFARGHRTQRRLDSETYENWWSGPYIARADIPYFRPCARLSTYRLVRMLPRAFRGKDGKLPAPGYKLLAPAWEYVQ